MVRIDTAPVRYFSQLDEDAFFRWAQSISCISSVEDGYFHIPSSSISEAELRDLIAIMYRYGMPMAVLRQFASTANEKWFKEPTMYWHTRVFGDA